MVRTAMQLHLQITSKALRRIGCSGCLSYSHLPAAAGTVIFDSNCSCRNINQQRDSGSVKLRKSQLSEITFDQYFTKLPQQRSMSSQMEKLRRLRPSATQSMRRRTTQKGS